MKKIDKIKIMVFIILRLSLIIAAFIALMNKNWMSFGMAILIFILLLMPSVAERRFKIDIPSKFEIVLILFIYAGTFLGDTIQLYERLPWWDTMLHGLSGFVLGNIGFLIGNYLNNSSKNRIDPSSCFVAFFSFCFAVAAGAIWEIYEFSIDHFLGFTMQGESLGDTMSDLILDAAGALIFAILVYLQQKGRINIIERLFGKLE